MEYRPHNYQQTGINHFLKNKKSAGFYSVGCGKTSMTLTALEYLINSLETSKVLIVSTPRIASQVWKAEIEKWDHLSTLTISRAIGSPAQRIKALTRKADIYTITFGNIAWMVHYAPKLWRKWPFTALIIDESSMVRNPQSMRFKALKKVAPLTDRVIILTGTPIPNKLLGIWSQVYLLDQGQRLGRTFTEFKDRYFKPGARNGHVIFQWEPKSGAEEQIFKAIEDICMSMKISDYLELPPRYDIYEEVELADRERYDEFKRTEVLTLSENLEITPVSAPAMYNKLLQYCNGAVYISKGVYEVVDDSKLDALIESVEALDGDPVFIIYQFISDYERIMKRLPHAIKIDSDELIEKWNRGEIEVGLAQIRSLSHGVNLQEGGNHIFHFGVSNDAEAYTQIVGRIDRQGVKKSVINKHFVIKGSLEEQVIKNTEGKMMTQEQLMNALKKELF